MSKIILPSGNCLSLSKKMIFTIPSLPISSVEISGGTETSVAGYKYHTFLSDGTLNISGGTNTCEVLIVAGGGGGGSYNGGGGGAGGLVYYDAVSLGIGDYAVTVGAGGIGGVAPIRTGTNGGNSSFGELTVAVGGGYGGNGNWVVAANSGGSGGGASGSSGPGNTGGAGTAGQGNAGGSDLDGWRGAGGGGAGEAANDQYHTYSFDNDSNRGGNGLPFWNPVDGSEMYYAGGGGPGLPGTTEPVHSDSFGGLGGGGAGGLGTDPRVAADGVANTGGGGGGSWTYGFDYSDPMSIGGTGGSGIVIVRYPL